MNQHSDESIQRLPDGSIDYSFYMEKCHKIRCDEYNQLGRGIFMKISALVQNPFYRFNPAPTASEPDTDSTAWEVADGYPENRSARGDTEIRRTMVLPVHEESKANKPGDATTTREFGRIFSAFRCSVISSGMSMQDE